MTEKKSYEAGLVLSSNFSCDNQLFLPSHNESNINSLLNNLSLKFLEIKL
ncbi:Uncharacterised protein [Mesomycoplasma hyorhinis]|nr:Uncharacterised protein [Mesomycoplasma hyorhinis]